MDHSDISMIKTILSTTNKPTRNSKSNSRSRSTQTNRHPTRHNLDCTFPFWGWKQESPRLLKKRQISYQVMSNMTSSQNTIITSIGDQ